HLAYDAFGKITSQTNSAEQPRFTYTARELDSDTGLYYYRARWYDATTGKFMSEDPIDFAGGDENLYRYVRNRPLNFVDSSGRTKQVYAFEGRAGYAGADRVPNPDGTEVVGAGWPSSASQVLNYWYNAVQAAGKDVKWHYLPSEGDWRAARNQIAQDAKKARTLPDGTICYDTIVLLGYSAGGWKVLTLSRQLQNAVGAGGGVKADLAVTVDPHPDEWHGGPSAVAGTLAGIGTPQQGGKGIDSWINFFQRLDKKSLQIGNVSAPLQGYQINGADNRLTGEGYYGTRIRSEIAHVIIPSLKPVTDAITTSIAKLPPFRRAYR
ncbi:MAG: RHS repeat-associated core domain-containing protein, partial [Pirellulales bacterium]